MLGMVCQNNLYFYRTPEALVVQSYNGSLPQQTSRQFMFDFILHGAGETSLWDAFSGL